MFLQVPLGTRWNCLRFIRQAAGRWNIICFCYCHEQTMTITAWGRAPARLLRSIRGGSPRPSSYHGLPGANAFDCSFVRGEKKKECECQLEVVGRMRRRVCNRGVGRGGHFLSNIVKLLEKLAAFWSFRSRNEKKWWLLGPHSVMCGVFKWINESWDSVRV